MRLFGRITRRTRRTLFGHILGYAPSRRLACSFVLHPESGHKKAGGHIVFWRITRRTRRFATGGSDLPGGSLK